MALEYSATDSERLLELVVRLSTKLEEPLLWEDIVCSATSLIGSDKGALLLVDEAKRAQVAASVGLASKLSLLTGLAENGLGCLTFDTTTPLVIDDIESFPLPSGWEGLTDECKSAAYLPFVTSENAIHAILAIFRSDKREHSPRERQLLSRLGLILHPVIANAQAQSSARRLTNAAEQRARKMHFLAEACAAISLAGGGVAALQRFASLATSWVADRCIIEIDDDSELAATYTVCRLNGEWCPGSYGPPPTPERRQWLSKLPRTGEPILLHGLSPHQPEIPISGCCKAEWGQGSDLAVMTLGLRKQRKVIGAMTLIRQETAHRTFDRDDVALAEEIVRHAELALDYESPRTARMMSTQRAVQVPI